MRHAYPYSERYFDIANNIGLVPNYFIIILKKEMQNEKNSFNPFFFTCHTEC